MLRPSHNLEVGKQKITFERVLLRDWLSLEETRGNIIDAAGKSDLHGINDCVISYILAASKSQDIKWDEQPWYTTLDAYETAIVTNAPTVSFPILKARNEEDKKLPWEYPGRTWYFWLNLFSAKYSWSVEYIAKLEIDDALGLLQEIKIDEQMTKEWDWGLSQNAYGYNETTKQSEFHELPRPNWMRSIAPPAPRMKMLKSMLPVGNVSYDEVTKPKDIKPI
jgi:hypothetical protein